MRLPRRRATLIDGTGLRSIHAGYAVLGSGCALSGLAYYVSGPRLSWDRSRGLIPNAARPASWHAAEQ